MVLSLKLEGMTKRVIGEILNLLLKFDFCRAPKF